MQDSNNRRGRRLAVSVSTVAIATVLSLFASLAAFASSPSPQSASSVAADFYRLPAVLPAANGTLVKQQPSQFFLDPLKAGRPTAEATRIMYKSTNGAGGAMAVTGTVLLPRSPWIGLGGRPLVVQSPGTQGLGDACAPSKQLALGTEYEGIWLSGLLARGYAVVMPDYEGSGTALPNTYMNRTSMGQAVLDAARAAINLDLPGIGSTSRVAISGYSQGGGASAAAAELAPAYAPELNIVGAYAGSVPADVQKFAAYNDNGPYLALTLYAVNGIAASEGIDLARFFSTAGLRALQQAAEGCVLQDIAKFAFLKSSSLTKSGQSISQLIAQEPFLSALQKQRIGVAAAPKFPVLVGQSVGDEIVPEPPVTELAKNWCAMGANVQYKRTVVPTHVAGYAALLPDQFAFLESRFAGLPALSNCRVI